MKRFELTVTRNHIEIYRTIFSFTQEQENDFFNKIKMLSEEDKGIDNTEIDEYVAANADILILGALCSQCLPLIEGIIAFENNIKKWGQQVKVITSNLGEVRWDCKRIGNSLEVVK